MVISGWVAAMWTQTAQLFVERKGFAAMFQIAEPFNISIKQYDTFFFWYGVFLGFFFW